MPRILAPRLYYWVWALSESQSSGISLTEVIQTSAALQEFVKNDKGFGQYNERYEEVSSDMAVRRQFAAWSAEMDKLDIAKEVGYWLYTSRRFPYKAGAL